MQDLKIIGNDFGERINSWLSLERMANLYPGSKYVGEFPLSKESTSSVSLFYQENPPEPFTNNYFGMYYNPYMDGVFIMDATEIASKERTGIVNKNNELIYSRNRHDFVVHEGDMIDGGDSYSRFSFGKNNGSYITTFKIEKDKIVIIGV